MVLSAETPDGFAILIGIAFLAVGAAVSADIWNGHMAGWLNRLLRNSGRRRE